VRRLNVSLLAAALALSLGAGEALAQQARSPLQLLHESREQLGAGKLDAALASAQAAVDADAALGEGWKQLGRVRMLRGDLAGALQSLTTAGQLLPGDPQIATWRSTVLLELGRFDALIEQVGSRDIAARRAVPEEWYARAAQRMIEKGAAMDAARMAALGAGAHHSPASSAAASALDALAHGNIVSATQRLRESAPTGTPAWLPAVAWYGLGRELQSQNHSAQAATALDRAMALAPEWNAPVRELGWLQRASGNARAAADVWSAAAGRANVPAQWWYWIAQARLDANQLKEASRALDRLLAIAPDHADGRALKLTLLVLRGDPAAASYEKELAASPDGAWLAAQAKALALRRRGDLRAAATVLEEWRDREPSRAVNLLADTYAQWAASVAPTDAVYPLESLVALQPDRVSAWRDLGWTYWTLGRRDDALIAWTRAVQGNLPEQRELSLQVVARLIEDGQTDLALSTYREWRPKESLGTLGEALLHRNRQIAARPVLLAAWDAGDHSPATGLYLAYTEAVGGRCVDLAQRLAPALDRGLRTLGPAETDRLFDALDACSDDPGTDPLVRKVTAAASDIPALTARVASLLGRSAAARAASRDLADAFGLFERSLKGNPDQPLIWLRAARLGNELGRRNDVESMLSEVARRAKSGAVRDGVNGYLASTQGDRETAVRLFRLSLSENPDQPDLRMALFNDLLALERYGDAREEAQWFAQRWALGDTGIRSQLAQIRAELGEHPQALKLWRELRLAYPESSYYGLETARALFTMCRADEANDVLREMVAARPNPRAYELLAEIAQAQGFPQQALDWTTAGVTIGETRGLLRMRAEAAEAGTMPEVAREASARLLAKDPANVPIARAYGRALLALGKSQAATDYYRGLVQRNPQFLPGLTHLRDLAAAHGDLPDAVDFATRIVAQRPGDGSAIRRQATTRAEAAHFLPALAAMRTEAELAPDSQVPVLLYRDVTSCDYPGRNTARQVAEHVEALAHAGLDLVGADTLAGPSTSAKPRVIVVVVNAEEDTIAPIDAALARVHGRAVYAADGAHRAGLSGVLGRMTASGRWEIASAGPADTRRVQVDSTGRLGNPLTHRLVRAGVAESPAETASRLDAALSRAAANLPAGKPRVLVYPGGDYGQLSLDTTDAAIADLHTAVARHFDLAIAQDTAGFARPDGDPLRVPALDVPANWDAQTLETWITRHRPATEAALQLAKILSWHGQHVAAESWYRRASELGADPVEISYQSGVNAEYAGDLPTALHRLRAASALAPESPRIATALERAEDRKHPVLKGQAVSWRDSDDRKYRSVGLEGATYISDSLRVLLFSDRNRWQRKGLGEEDGTRLGAGLRWHFAEGRWLDARAWRMDLDDLDGKSGWQFGLHLPLALPDGTLDLSAGRDPIDTVEAVRAGIMADTLQARSYLRIADAWDLFADLGYIDRTDHNKTWQLSGRLLRRLREAPLVELGYRFRFGDSDRDPPEYWAPLGLQQHQLYGAWNGELGPLAWSLSAEAGYADEKDTDWRFVWGGRARVDYRLSPSLSVGGQLNRLETPNYTRDDYSLRLEYRF